jgi:hypothetical protein
MNIREIKKHDAVLIINQQSTHRAIAYVNLRNGQLESALDVEKMDTAKALATRLGSEVRELSNKDIAKLVESTHPYFPVGAMWLNTMLLIEFIL